MYILARCPRCGFVVVAKANQKTKLCPRCDRRFKITGGERRFRTREEAIMFKIKYRL